MPNERSGGGHPCCPDFAEAGDLAQAEADGETAVSGFERIVPVARVDVDRAHLDPVGAGVGDDLRGCIEPHRLGVE